MYADTCISVNTSPYTFFHVHAKYRYAYLNIYQHPLVILYFQNELNELPFHCK